MAPPAPGRLAAPALFLAAAIAAGPAGAELRGHGGPVRALAAGGDGDTAVTGSFDGRAIRWALRGERALDVTRFHEGAVTAVAALPDGRFASAGEDGRVALWAPGGAAGGPEAVLEGHRGPVVGLAVAPDGGALASASWDRTARLWPLRPGGAGPRTLDGHAGNVMAAAFLPDGRLATAGYDATLRIWPADPAAPPRVVTVGAALNALAAAPDGELVAAAGDGRLRFFGPDGEARGEVAAGQAALTAVAVSPDGRTVAAAGVRGAVVLLDRASRDVRANLVGPGLPVWSLAFLPAGDLLLTGGADGVVRRWDARTGAPLDSVLAMTDAPGGAEAGAEGGDPEGARVFRACAACHALGPEGEGAGPRAGPTLHGLFGRKIASVPGYDYSPALRGMDIVWTPETVGRLFTEGPSRVTPGTRMPEQVVRDPADLSALLRFLRDRTAGAK